MAGNPPIFNSSFSGSGLPYINPNIAFDNTPNIGKTTVINNKIKIPLCFPSSFYSQMGKLLVEPSIFIKIESLNGKIHQINIKNSIPYRQCVHHPKKFQINSISLIDKQENILRSKSYPLKNIDI